jgi:hypothetical protein
MHLTYHDSDGHKATAATATAEEAGAPEHICEIPSIRGGEFPIRLVCDADSKRLMLRGINEGGFSCVDIDLLDIVDWLHSIAPSAVNFDELARAATVFAAGAGAC